MSFERDRDLEDMLLQLSSKSAIRSAMWTNAYLFVCTRNRLKYKPLSWKDRFYVFFHGKLPERFFNDCD